MNITFIGSGNVAWHLSDILQKNNHNIVEIWSKSEKNAKLLAAKLNCSIISDLNVLKSTDLIIISVKDDFIIDVLNKIEDFNIPIVHTSGSVGIDIFQNRDNFGIFYPVQSFNKNIDIDFNEIPICIESNNSELEKTLLNLANSISNSVHLLNYKQREQLHIAAVFASNFTNHMMLISDKILNSNKMSFDLLKPLIKNTFEKVKNNHPKDVQTGPAIREDYLIIEKHLKLLEESDDLKIIYSKISNHIINNNLNE
ncbi:F420-dependent NADP oxidoreductase [Flavobacteriales bacterium]|nr:F420-dependent NADP oxidoreductase [Flavobacteriales bacterium]